ncbi:MAG: glycosyltransferase family 39 protein [Deltaproteobacteria bacterium]|nr:glycosyltransferase family 39 protein [Deltaproteobacteria bacterium]
MSEQEKKDVETDTPSETETSNADAAKADATKADAASADAKADDAKASDPAHEIGAKAAASSDLEHEIGAPPSRPATSDLAASAESELTPGPAPTPPAPTVPLAPAAPARPRRTPAQIGRGVFLTLLGLVPLFTIMALDHQIARGPLWGILSTLVLAVGVLDLVGLFTPAHVDLDAARPWRETWIAPEKGEPMFLAPVVAIPVAALLVIGGALFASWSALPWIILAALGCLVPAALRRPGLLVFTFGSAIILPFLGTMGLWDPWETHYGEVAREILSRDDWISTWWAHEEWFFSKPIFIFWVESLSMGALGVGFQPDMMLSPTPELAHPEWAIRLPHYLESIVAIVAVYVAISRNFGKRAGALASVVLVTMPHFFFLSHQSITDMPFVSTMTIAMSFLILAISEDPEREVRGVRFGNVVLSFQHLVAFGLVALITPQALYLVSRNVTLVEGGFAWHRDQFWFGSGGGNAGNPGNPALREMFPAYEGPFAQPTAQGLYWLIGLGVLLYFLRKERRAQAFAMFGFYVFCALSFMAKGIPGFALPGLVALFFLLGSKRWALLLEGRLRVALGIVTVLSVGGPWYVAMYIRHGSAFTDRLLIHDHINRLTAGVHGDTGSAEYFFEQLGFGTFPWIAMAPLAIGAWAFYARRDNASAEERRKSDVAMLVGLWGTSAFVLFSAMTTKFHHYIFPAVPPAGILIGLALEPLWAQATTHRWKNALGTVIAALAPLPAVLGVGGLWGDLRGIAPRVIDGEVLTGQQLRDWVTQHPHPSSYAWAGAAASIALFVIAWRVLRPAQGETLPVAQAQPLAMTGVFTSPALPAAGVGLVAATALVGVVGRDLSWATDSRPFGYERLIHLFVYNYQRSWPDQYDYRPILTGFAIAAGVLIGLAALSFFRATALRALVGLAFSFAVWGLDVYLPDLSPHWGQRSLFAPYYERRTGPEERVIAWQMNWKGENFYSGNACYIFVDLDTRALTTWAGEHDGERHFVVLEPSRVGGLRSTLRGSEVVRETTTYDNNHFMLVSVILGRTGEAARRYREEHGIPEPTPEQLQ